MDEDLEKLGRAICADERLLRLRKRLRLTPSAMADLLHVALRSYQRWEINDAVLRKESARRLGRFYRLAQSQLKQLKGEGIVLRNYMPFHEAAGELGVPQETLFKRYRADEFQAEDFGILGLWVEK